MVAMLEGLFIFGLMYAGLAALLRYLMPDHGYTAFLVVGGVAVVLLGFGTFYSADAARVAFMCFAAAGLPMVVGDVLGNLVRSRQAARRNAAAIHEGLHDDRS